MKKEIIITEVDGKINFQSEGFSNIELVGIFDFLRVRQIVNMDKREPDEQIKEKPEGGPKK